MTPSRSAGSAIQSPTAAPPVNTPSWTKSPSALTPSLEERDAHLRKASHPRGIPRALRRTRTDDPFLTMEVLYQLS
jgi:hypothetical protein